MLKVALIALIFSFSMLSLFPQHVYGVNIYINHSLNQSEVEAKICQVENGLLPAIEIQGIPVSRMTLDQQMQRYKIPAVSIAVIDNGEIEWAKSYGVLEANTDRTADLSSLFQAGSVSKPIAAFGALSLVQNKTLELNEDVNQRLISWKIPENQFTALRKVTLKHLLSHTSGFNVIGFDGYREEEKIPTLIEILNGIPPANHPPIQVECKPGERLSYSGGGYTVMQQLVEDCTGHSFAKFMDNCVFKPLGMSRSTMSYPLPPHLRENVAIAHPSNGLPMKGSYKTYPESSATGLWSTPTDIAKWMIHIQNSLVDGCQQHILNQEMLRLMLTPQIAPYGLGSVVNGRGDFMDFSHRGRTDGFACEFVACPFLGKGIVVMMNANEGSCLMDEVIRGVSEVYQWPSYKSEVKKEIQTSLKDLTACQGRYGTGAEKNDIYDTVVSEKNGELFIRFGYASTPYKLHKEGENKFFLVETGFEVLFHEEHGVTKQLVVIIQSGFDRIFNKFAE